jgi:hypothetical protein
MSARLDPAEFPGAMRYEHSDVPPGMTLRDWRRQRAQQRAPQQPRRLARLRRRLRRRSP